MVKVTYDSTTLVKEMVPGESIVLHGHKYVMPSNIEIITDKDYLKPSGTYEHTIVGNKKETLDIGKYKYVEITVTEAGAASYYEGSFTIR